MYMCLSRLRRALPTRLDPSCSSMSQSFAHCSRTSAEGVPCRVYPAACLEVVCRGLELACETRTAVLVLFACFLDEHCAFYPALPHTPNFSTHLGYCRVRVRYPEKEKLVILKQIDVIITERYKHTRIHWHNHRARVSTAHAESITKITLSVL